VTLTPEQKAAVGCRENILLDACPGSGKTRVIIEKLAEVIDEVEETPRAIACITYTNTAVNEIEQRLRESLRVGDERYFEVSTIHAFCLTNIMRPFCWRVRGYEAGFDVLTRDMEEFEGIVKEVCAEFRYFQPRFQDYEDFAALSMDVDGNPIGAAVRNSIVEGGARPFWALCRQRGYIDFSNILYHSLSLLREYPEIADGLASRFAWILVDEFQDTTDLQVEILSAIAERRRTKFFLVGDGNQSIFGFAGARPELAGIFADRIGARIDLSLSGNFRSSPPIVTHAERLFPRQPPMRSLGPSRIYSELPEYHNVPNYIDGIIDYFIPTLESLDISLGEATVLASSWSPLFPLARRLRNFGYPVVGPGARPYRRSRLFATLAEQLCGTIADPMPDSIAAIERGLFYSIRDLTGEPRIDVFSYNGRLIVMKLLHEAERQAAIDDSALRWLDDTSVAVGEILAASELIAPSDAAKFYASVQEMKSDMRNNQVDTANLSIADLGLFASPQRAMKLSTLHFAKGREFDAVAIIRAHEGSMPDFRSDTAEAIEGDKRLFYVGVTRARRLLMYFTDTADRRNRPSRFLGPNGVRIVQ
jgi:DNA helicase II / ATP-dependent DNA helicase PcrA